MAVSTAGPGFTDVAADSVRHAAWVRLCHWVSALSFVFLAISGFFILMVHPRLYWGEVGNDLTPAILELPISNNHRPELWEQTVTFGDAADAPFSANRTYRIFNQNGWARSLHFLTAWLLVAAGAFYLVLGVASGHLWRNVIPDKAELRPRAVLQDVLLHLRLRLNAAGGQTAPYGVLQKAAYASVVLIAFPLMVISGLAMSPAVTAGYPILLDLFGGHQTARTIHFFGFAALILFFVVHMAMVVLTGFRQQLRAMILGK